MFTRLIFRKPFQVARAGMMVLLSDVLTFVMVAEIEPGSGKVDVVRGDLVAQEPPRGAVVFERYDEAPREIAQPRNHDQRDVVLSFPPADAADLVVRNE